MTFYKLIGATWAIAGALLAIITLSGTPVDISWEQVIREVLMAILFSLYIIGGLILCAIAERKS